MVAEHEEILSPKTLVSLNEFVGVPFLRLKQWQNVLEAKLRGMSIVLLMIIICIRSFHIHLSCHPVA